MSAAKRRAGKGSALAPVALPAPFDAAETIPVAEFSALGVHAFTTTRHAGSYRLDGADAAGEVVARWHGLQSGLGVKRLASARQVHGAEVLLHLGGWRGWLRYDGADGHITAVVRTALAVGIADCVPVFLAHENGTIALLHAGWRGTAGAILARGVEMLGKLGAAASGLHVHFGPAICGRCYEVSPEVYAQLTGSTVTSPTHVDLRSVLARQAGALGIAHVSQSPLCTRCDNDRLFSHRAGDAGRMVAVIARSG